MIRFARFVLLVALIIPSNVSAETVDYAPVVETITAGTTTGFGLLDSDDGQVWTGTESCAVLPCNLFIVHDFDSVAFGDITFAEVKVRASQNGEVFSLAAFDWQDAVYAILFDIDTAVEESYSKALPFVCGSGGADCFINPNRDVPAPAVSLRWLDSGVGPDAVAHVVTVDMEVIRIVRTEPSSTQNEWAVRVGTLLFVIFLIFGFWKEMPLFVFIAGAMLTLLTFAIFFVTGQTWLLIIGVLLGPFLMILSAFQMLEDRRT